MCACSLSHTHEWVMAHMNESWLACERVVCYVCVKQAHMAYRHVCVNESCHAWMSHVTHEWVMSHMIYMAYRHVWRSLIRTCRNFARKSRVRKSRVFIHAVSFIHGHASILKTYFPSFIKIVTITNMQESRATESCVHTRNLIYTRSQIQGGEDA